jgi:hypothetical protein
MDHKLAEGSRFAERYLLGELSAVERDEFEEHYFECVLCAQQVRDGAVLAANTRAVFQDLALSGQTEPVSLWDRLFGWMRAPALAYAATVLLGSVTAYQNVVTIPSLEEATKPQFLASTVLRPSARGGVPVVVHPGDKFVHLMLDVNTAEPYETYRAEVRDSAGNQVMTLENPGEIRAGLLSLLLPAERLHRGDYSLIMQGVRSGSTTEIDKYEFTIPR